MGKYICLVVIILSISYASAQERSTRPKRELLLPEFYHASASHNGDTTFQYELYDADDKLIPVSTLKSVNEIEHIN